MLRKVNLKFEPILRITGGSNSMDLVGYMKGNKNLWLLWVNSNFILIIHACIAFALFEILALWLHESIFWIDF